MDKFDITEASYRHPIILFDGECHLCDGTVQMIIKFDRKDKFKFLSLQKAKDKGALLVDTDSVVLVHFGQIYVESHAAIQIIALLGQPYTLISKILSFIPSDLANKIYRWIAKNRIKWFGKKNSCHILPREAELW